MPKKKSLDELLDTKPGKYFLERKKGKTKRDSAISAGYADYAHTSVIENSVTYREIVKSYKDELLEVISLKDIARAHAENITQDKDRGARNTAIKMAYDKIEGTGEEKDDTDKLVVILR